MTATLYCLAKDQEVQNKVREEIKKVLGDAEETAYLTFEEQKQMVYLNNVIKEAIRLYPAANFLFPRRAARDTTINGIPVEKGTQIFISTFMIQRNPKHWKDPLKFDPSRFEKDVKPFSWIPFGIGARICLGKNFAMVEMKVLLSMILRNYQVSLPVDSPHQEEMILKGDGLALASDVQLIFNKLKM